MKVSVSDLKVMSLYAVRDEIAERMAARMRIGTFDWCFDSHSMSSAMARAVRVWFRVVRGARVSKAEAAGF